MHTSRSVCRFGNVVVTRQIGYGGLILQLQLLLLLVLLLLIYYCCLLLLLLELLILLLLLRVYTLTHRSGRCIFEEKKKNTCRRLISLFFFEVSRCLRAKPIPAVAHNGPATVVERTDETSMPHYTLYTT